MLLTKRNRQAAGKLLIILYLLPKVRNYKCIFWQGIFVFQDEAWQRRIMVKRDYSSKLE
jgi:hypothetical protein